MEPWISSSYLLEFFCCDGRRFVVRAPHLVFGQLNEEISMLMIRLISVAASVSLLGGCATIELTQQGAAVRPVTANEKEKYCSFIGIIEGFGAPLTGGMQKAMTDVRNGIGKSGGNGMYIISTRSEPYGGGCCYSYVTAEALRCEFRTVRAVENGPKQ